MSHSHKNPLFVDNIKNTVVLESNTHGFGLYATKDIPKNTLLCELTGQIVGINDYKKFKEKINDETIFIEKCILPNSKIMIIPLRTKYGYINHDNHISNIKEVLNTKTNTIKVYTKTNIKQNEEILDRYNLETHDDILGGFKNDKIY